MSELHFECRECGNPLTRPTWEPIRCDACCVSARYEDRIEALEADAALGRIVRESGATADDCLDAAVAMMSIDTPVAAMLSALAEALRKERGR